MTFLADSLAHVWNYIYDNKVYAYNYLLDKMNKSELLDDFEKQFRETNQRIASARDQVASAVVYGYPLRKKLVLSYEMALAGILGYIPGPRFVGESSERGGCFGLQPASGRSCTAQFYRIR